MESINVNLHKSEPLLNTGVDVMRLNKLIKVIDEVNVDAAVVIGQPNITYFTGVTRPEGGVLIVLKGGYVEFLIPVLEFYRVYDVIKGFNIELIPYSRYDVEFDVSVVKNVVDYIRGRLSGVTKVGIDLNYINYATYQLIKLLGHDVVDLSRHILDVRAIKEEDEVKSITKALSITEEALVRAFNELKPKVSEAMFAGLLEMYMRYLGAEGLAFNTIVASGHNSSYPHALPTSKELGYGESIVIDLGAVYANYCSDITRTVYIGNPPNEVIKALEAVTTALSEVEDYVAPYVRVSEVDTLARKTLSKYGLSKYFIHSVGHGVGVEVHELPRIASGIDDTLKPGMVITLEPGVYVRGSYGVRVEDMILITNSGRKILNKLPQILT